MDFTFTTEQEELRRTVRKFAENELAPLVREAEESESFPRQLFRRFGELGLILLLISRPISKLMGGVK